MAWWQAVALGLVEGITEYLPVSSTGHLILANAMLGLDDPARKEAVDAFAIVVQGGAILAVLGLYWTRVRQMLLGLAGRDRQGLVLLRNIALAFVPAMVLGPVLDDLIEAYLFSTGPVLFALAAGGAWMIWLDHRAATAAASATSGSGGPSLSIGQISPKQALAIGLFQCVAMWPGTSRSMMTIAGGRMLGLPAAEAAEFSFLVGLPTLGAACCFKLLKNLKHAHDDGTQNLFELLGFLPVAIGILVATVSAVLAVRWLVSFLTRRGLAPFGYYRIALSAVLLVAVLAGVLDISAD